MHARVVCNGLTVLVWLCDHTGVKADRVGVERLCQSVRQDFRQVRSIHMSISVLRYPG